MKYRKTHPYRYLVLWLMCLMAIGARAGQPPLTKDLYPQASIANVGAQPLSFQDFYTAKDELPFRPLKRQNEDLGFTSDFYWLQFPLHNTENIAKTVFLETARPITDVVELYLMDEATGQLQKMVSGDQLPFEERNFEHRKSIFEIQLLPNARYQAYLQLGSDGEVISVPLKLHSTTGFVLETYKEQIFYGVFYGILLLAFASYLFFYISLKDRTFLYYSLYTLFIGLLQFSLDGFFFQYVAPAGGWLNSRAVLGFALIANLFLGKYAEHFLNYRSHLRGLLFTFRGIYVALGATLAALLVWPHIPAMAYISANVLGLLSILLILASVGILRLREVRVDVFFTLGIVFLVSGFVVFILNNFGVVPTNFLTANATKFGTGLEIIFLSLSMINRIRTLRIEKEQIQNEALNHLREMNDLKSYFMSNMSHELRTPLNAIMGIADYMIKEGGDKKVVANSQIIKNASVGLLSCVNDILDFDRIQKGELHLVEDDFDIKHTLQQVAENFERQAYGKGLTFYYHPAPQLPEVGRGDMARLLQILNNVLSNAIKFTSTGSVTMEVKHHHRADGQRLEIVVSDTGVGIKKEKLDAIFSSFTQAEVNDKRQFGGLGLGLTIVKELVRLHGGQVFLHSEPGKGTRCTISLPYQLMPRTATPIDVSSNEYDLHGASILLVEDNPVNQMIVKKLLSMWKNTEIEVANDGRQALDKLAEKHFDLILMDLQMPVMDGYETATEIRSGRVGDDLAHIPIIAVTADTMEKTRNRIFEVGMNDYQTKPIDQDVLYKRIAEQLNKIAANTLKTA